MCMYERVFITRQKRNSGVLLANVGVTWNSHRWLWAVASQYVAVHGCLEVIERERAKENRWWWIQMLGGFLAVSLFMPSFVTDVTLRRSAKVIRISCSWHVGSNGDKARDTVNVQRHGVSEHVNGAQWASALFVYLCHRAYFPSALIIIY